MTQPDSRPRRSYRRWLLHAYRVGIFVVLLVAIRQQHSWFLAQREGIMKQLIQPAEIMAFYPEASTLSEWDPVHGGQNVFDEGGKKLGHVLQTTPDSDEIYGFSGPTNTLVAFDAKGKILGIRILRSDDTREHLAEVKKDRSFLTQWNGLSRDEAAAKREFDTVSGATLSSLAISDGIATRLGGTRTSRFPGEIEVGEVESFLPGAFALEAVEKRPYMKRVVDKAGGTLGFVSRTSPHADHMTGYQGPTDLLIVLDPAELVVGLAIRKTLDNEPYVKLLTEDEYFFNAFKGFTLPQLAQLDIVESGLDVVSGATKTSVTVVEGLIFSAPEISRPREPLPPEPFLKLRVRDAGTILVVLLGVIIALTSLKGNRRLRWAFQAVLIIYLGFINADLLSQALVVGWARSGIAWEVAPGLVFLSAAALVTPIITGRQVYCTHLCPFGAVQDWIGKRSPWKRTIKGRFESWLGALPVVLLLWGFIIAMKHLPVSLVSLEPFDAFVVRVAGGATIAIAIVGLFASVFLQRAYCRYGCPTGAMLKFVRFGGTASERLGQRDFVAAGFALLAIGMMVWR